MKSGTKSRHHRRDRRKAKQSGYAREGKINMGTRIGHGTTGSGGPRTTHAPIKPSKPKQQPPKEHASFPLLADGIAKLLSKK